MARGLGEISKHWRGLDLRLMGKEKRSGERILENPAGIFASR
jgi:hypothetical protein